MKERIYKLLWVDTPRLRRKGRFYAWLTLFLGILAIVGPLALYGSISERLENAVSFVDSLALELPAVSMDTDADKKTVEAASGMLGACSKFVAEAGSWGWYIIALLGVLLLFQSLLYFRIHEILNER